MIPNFFHFVFGLKKQTEPLHLVHALAIISCAKVNKPVKIFFHYQHEPHGPYWEVVRPLVKLIKVVPPDNIFGIPITHYAHQADIIRLNALLEFGGVYADMDTIFVNPLSPDLFTKPFVMGQQGEMGLCNAFMMSSRQSRFAKRWLDGHSSAFKGGKPGTPEWDNHSVYFPGQLAKAIPLDIHIEPQSSFFKHLFTKAGVDQLFEKKDTDFKNVYSMHLWENITWKDYLSKLTPGRIESKDTTYNCIARRFLDEI
ncbi:glycosyltransferase [Desulfovibrio gilichinskyi]|uniref:Glycosyltransferase sugar-binding region containing DXD motif-containing protein n=1 Tax=Desulfovibrio gilichinskyi TaxID=1519643 RepID=A0A1X7E8S7_9BACT|nr:glycosyltransferase [Desulfovibrio gilichinskyi]SMF29077.1 Glycosyltransferase sugar-binding region containing DXD motif-containing protein [Desulfovibrio gilichinskyi]